MMNRDQTRQWLVDRNVEYRLGESTVSDALYDEKMNDFNQEYPDDILFQKGILEISGIKSEKLPIPMFSLNKVKTIEDLFKWLLSKGILEHEELIITAKYDGISLCIDEEFDYCWTRGDGVEGERKDVHYKSIVQTKRAKSGQLKTYTFGELLFPKKAWVKHFEGKINPYNGLLYKTARNTIAGTFNRDTIIADDIIKHSHYMRYGYVDKSNNISTRKEELNLLNILNEHEVKHITLTSNLINIDILNSLYELWSKDYQIDGLVIEVASQYKRDELGRERNNNPAYAIAFKNADWSETGQSRCGKTTLKVSKQGKIKPVATLNPSIIIGGVEISNVTGYNMKYIFQNNITEGSLIEIVRSGDVIPKHLNTIEFDEEAIKQMKMDVMFCPSCGSETYWDENNVELMCSKPDTCYDVQLSKAIHFFKTIEIESFGEGEIENLFKLGYNTVEKLLNITEDELLKLDGWAKKSAKTYLNQLHKFNTEGLPIAKIIHALDLMQGKVGSKVIQKVFDEYKYKGEFRVEDLCEIDGISDITAIIFRDGYYNYMENYYKTIPIKVSYYESPILEQMGNKYVGLNICVSGFRDADLNAEIESNGGKIVSGVSKTTNYLIVKDTSATGGKITKAEKHNVPIVSKDEFINKFNNI